MLVNYLSIKEQEIDCLQTKKLNVAGQRRLGVNTINILPEHVISLILFLPFCSFLFSVLAGARLTRENGLVAFICVVWGVTFSLAALSFYSLISTGVTVELLLAT